MALDTAPLLRVKSQLAFALETTNNTAATVGASQAVTRVYNANTRYTTERVEQQSEGSASPRAQGRGARPAACDFETDVMGSGSSGTDPDWAKLLRACGMSVTSRVYTPLTAPTETLTIGHYQHGRLKKPTGCMGSFVLTARGGRAARIRWSFQGVQQPPSATSLIVPTKSTVVAPRCAITFTIGGVQYRMPEIVLDAGNKVELREDLAGVDASGNPTGYRCGYVTDRLPTFKVAPEALPLGTKDWYDFYQSGTTAALSLVIGSASNNVVTIAAPKLELMTDPEDGDRNGKLVDNLTFVPLANSDAGDDEYSITFSDS